MQITPQIKKLLCLFVCILLLIYLAVVCLWANWRADQELCVGLENNTVAVNDRMHTGFVSADEITAEVTSRLGKISGRRLSDINLDSLQLWLAALDKIETASAMRLTDNRLRVEVTPMVPVARVWPKNGASFYVNRDGKRIRASAKYRIDVPQVAGLYSPTVILPLLDYLSSDADADRLVTMISAVDTTNIILVPAIRGHVINLGDTRNIPDKFARLKRFYSEVLPVKGWEHYDTISLKWDNQIVATRRHNKLPDLTVPVIGDLENEGDNLETISVN